MTESLEAPLVTFALFTYNQEQYVEEAVRAAMSQDYSPLEVIISDDASTDRTFAILEKLVADYVGPHRIVLNRNPENLGIAGHVNQVMRLSQGDLIVVAAGDDISLPERARVMMRSWIAAGKRVGSLFSSYAVIDTEGTETRIVRFSAQRWVEDSKGRLDGGVLVVGATHCWSRSLFERYGDIGFDAVNEDAVIQFRASLEEGVDIVEEVLIKYRLHEANVSNLHYGEFEGESREALVTRIGYERTLKCLKNYAKDLAIARGIEGSPPGIERLQRHAEVKVRLCELRLRFLEGGFLQRLSAIIRSFCLGHAGFQGALGMLLQAVMPGAYRFARSLAYRNPSGGPRD